MVNKLFIRSIRILFSVFGLCNYMKNKKRKIIIAIILIVLAVAVVLIYTRNNNGDGDGAQKIEKRVVIQNITRQDSVTAPLTSTSTVEPKQHSIIRSLTPGTVMFLPEIGSQVIVGQPLFGIMDSNIENNFFNAMQSLEQTEIVADQRVSQAELALISAKSRLDLAGVSLNNVIAQNEQATRLAEDSATVAYNSAFNTMNQVLNFITVGNIEDHKYIYADIATPFSQFRRDTENMLPGAAESFLELLYPLDSDSLIAELNKIHSVLLEVKNLTDNTLVVLQNAIDDASFSSARIEGDKVIISGYQTQINAHISSIISSISSIENTKIGNRLSLDQAANRLDLAQIDFDNASISLDNASEGAVLEKNAAKSQFDIAAYNYDNLSLPAPFSGTIISHFVREGEQVSVGQQIVELGDLSILEIRTEVNISFAEAIRLGDEVIINEKYKGFVSEIEPIGDLVSGKVSLTVESGDQELALMAGGVVEIRFNLNYIGKDMIVVPIKSVIVESTGNYVFILEDGIASKRDVSLGQVFGDKVQIISGLDVQDKLILQDGVFIVEGDKVEVIEEK